MISRQCRLIRELFQRPISGGINLTCILKDSIMVGMREIFLWKLWSLLQDKKRSVRIRAGLMVEVMETGHIMSMGLRDNADRPTLSVSIGSVGRGT